MNVGALMGSEEPERKLICSDKYVAHIQGQYHMSYMIFCQPRSWLNNCATVQIARGTPSMVCTSQGINRRLAYEFFMAHTTLSKIGVALVD